MITYFKGVKRDLMRSLLFRRKGNSSLTVTALLLHLDPTCLDPISVEILKRNPRRFGVENS
jgi:hypothetical protein